MINKKKVLSSVKVFQAGQLLDFLFRLGKFIKNLGGFLLQGSKYFTNILF